ncbi:hypothetical protein NSTC731_06370 [Nostoc sp. DSM 114167]|jgi:hypothetical protein
MAYPFPGMNPYLEDPELWPGVHGRLIVAMSDDKLLCIYADYFYPQLRPKYFVADLLFHCKSFLYKKLFNKFWLISKAFLKYLTTCCKLLICS